MSEEAITALRRRVETLEKRVAELEARDPARPEKLAETVARALSQALEHRLSPTGRAGADPGRQAETA